LGERFTFYTSANPAYIVSAQETVKLRQQ
jgi:hypothetical protein